MSALTTAAHRLRPINNRAVMVGACAVLVLLSVPIAPVAKAQGLGLIDASYAADVKLSDVRLERGKGNEVHISGRVTNSGQKIVTGLKARVTGARATAHSGSPEFVIVGPDQPPLKPNETRSFEAAVRGLTRRAGARIEVEPASLLTQAAPTALPPPDDGTPTVVLFIGSLVILGILLVYYNLPSVRAARRERAAQRAAQLAEQARQQAEALKRQEEAAQKLLEVYTSAPDLPTLNANVSGVILQRGENCCFIEPNVGHIVTSKRTRYVGGSQGISFRIARGVYYRVGAYSGQPITETSEAVGDMGILYVTDQRVIFAGGREVTTVPVKKVADVRIAGNDVVVLSENRKTPFIMRSPTKYGSVVAAAAIRRVADDAVGSPHASLVPPAGAKQGAA